MDNQVKIIVIFLITIGLIASSCTSRVISMPASDQQASTSNEDNIKSPETLPSSQATKAAQEKLEIERVVDLLNRPERYKDRSVTIEGKIVSQCNAGCWFILNDGTGTIYVDLSPSNLTIPQKRGAIVKVHGRVIHKNGDIYLVSERVEFK